MVRQDLINSLTESFPGIPKQDMLSIVAAFFESMAQALMEGEAVELRGLGRFKVKERGPAAGRNPKTDTPVQLPGHWVVRFKAAQSLISRMNNEALQDPSFHSLKDTDVTQSHANDLGDIVNQRNHT